MKTLFLFLIIFARCLISSAVNVPFASPPFDPHAFIVDQKGNFIGLIGSETNDPFGSTYNIGFTNIQGTNYFFIYGTLTNNTTGSAASATNSPDGTSLNLMVTNVVYTNSGPAWLIVNKTSFLNTNNFSGGGGGGSGTLTNGVYTNSGPDTVVVSGSGTLALNTNKFAAPVDSRAWTNLNNGVSKFNGTVQMGKLTSDGGGIHSDGSGGLQVGTLTSLLTLAAGGGGFTVDSSGNETALNHTGSGAGLTTLNASALSSGTAPVARLPVGTSSSLGVLQPDGTSITVSGGVISAPGAGGGTVISVALADGSSSPIYTISGSPVTTTGTLTFSLANEAALSVFGNFSGSPAQPTFSTSPTFNGGNISSLNASHLTTGTVPAAQMPAFTGDITTSAGTVATTLKNTGTAGTYTKTTFDAQGRETSGTAAVLASSDYANQGQVHQVLHGNAAGNPSFSAVDLANDVTGNLSVNNLNGGSSASSSTFWRGDGTWAAATGASGITALSGDVTATGPGSAAATTVGINGTILSGLASGLLYITTGTGVPTTKATWPNVAAVLTSLIPQSALGTGSGGTGTKFLADDQTYKTVSGGTSGVQMGGITRPYFITSTNINGGNNKGAAFGDLNGDGLPDVIIGGPTSIQVFTNNRSQLYLPIPSPGMTFPLAQTISSATTVGGFGTIADLNNDGRLDYVAVDGTSANNFQIYTNDGNAKFTKVGSSYAFTTPVFVVVGDLNGDGSNDLVVVPATGASTAIGIYTNNGAATFNSASTLPLLYSQASLQDVAIGDMNGDGRPDLVIGFINGGISVLTNDGKANFTFWTTNVYNGVYGITIADVNKDGKNDILFVQNASGLICITNNGTGFGGYSTNSLNYNPSFFQTSMADFNGDGLADIVLMANGQSSFITMTNSGTTAGFPIMQTNTVGPGSGIVGIAALDFNGDGFPDVGVGTTSFGSAAAGASILINNPLFQGAQAGDGSHLTNGQISIVYGTAATSWTPSVATTNLGTLNLSTNFVPYKSSFDTISINNGLNLTNISFCTTSASSSGTVTSANTHQIETTYMSSGSTIVSLTWALPTSTTLGKIFYLHSKSAITTLTITGGSFIDTAVVAMTAGQTIGFETIDGAGTYIRMQ